MRRRKKQFKGRDLIDAIKKNRIAWERGSWFRAAKGGSDFSHFGIEVDASLPKIGAACVMGVGYINLGITGRIIEIGSDSHMLTPFSVAIADITTYNDRRAVNWGEARDFAIERLTPFADVDLEAIARRYSVERIPAKS